VAWRFTECSLCNLCVFCHYWKITSKSSTFDALHSSVQWNPTDLFHKSLHHTANIPKWRNTCWKVCNGLCGYLKHVIIEDAFIALQTPVMGAQVLWLVCLCSSLSVCPRGYLRNYKYDLYQSFCACCLRSWLYLLPAKGAKSAIIIIIIHKFLYRHKVITSEAVPWRLPCSLCGSMR